MRKLGIALGVVAIAAMLLTPAFAANRGVEFIPTGIPTGAFGSFATSMTADGGMVAGSAGSFGSVGGCIVWDEANGWQTLDFNSGACYMSRDGLSFTADQADPLGFVRAARWDGTDFVIVSDLPTTGSCDSTIQSTFGISGDGSTIVGLAYDLGCGDPVGFSHTEAGGLVHHAKIRTDRAARVNAANWDGSVLGGWNDNIGRQGMIWRDGVPEFVFDSEADPTVRVGEVYDINTDGSAMAGIGFQMAGVRGIQGWVYDDVNGVRGTGSLPGGGFFSQGLNFTVNEDGTMAGGAFGFGPFRDATLWTEATGIMNLNQFLIDQGRTEPFDGWLLVQVNAMSDDGTRLAVFAANPDSAFFGNETVILDISKVSVCHAPPGNPGAARTLNINWDSMPDHVGHGDFLGTCEAASGGFARAVTPFEYYGVDPNSMNFRNMVGSYSAEHSAMMPIAPEQMQRMIEAGQPELQLMRGDKGSRAHRSKAR